MKFERIGLEEGMTDTIKITYATRDEIFEIAVFLDACWKSEYSKIVAPDFLGDLSVDKRHEMLLVRFDEGTSAFLIMRDGKRMIGASVSGKSFTEGYPEDGEVSAIYLHHDYIGKGYGHALLSKIERELTAKGYPYFVLDVLSANTRAVSFYEKHGYEKVDDRIIKLGAHDYPLTVFRKKNPLIVRQETPADHAAVYALNKAAFAEMEHADGTEQDLVERLRGCDAFIPELSLVAEKEGTIIGHIMFTKITIGGAAALCLAPVSVFPEYQRQGVGTVLIERGHEIAADMGYGVCTLVGHADYYPRFGYERASKYGITQPFPAPDECVMVKFLTDAGKSVTGAAVFPPEFY